MKHIFVFHKNLWFEEFQREVCSWDDVQIVDPAEATYDQADDPDVHYQIWGQHEWFTVAHRLPLRRACRMTLRYFEQIPHVDVSGLSHFQQTIFRALLEIAEYFDEIYVSTKLSAMTLQRKLPAMAAHIARIPLGYTPCLGTPQFDLHQDIDILMYGTPTSRRESIANLMMPRLDDLEIVGITDVWGEQRNDLIRRAKILLHIQNVPRLYPSMRMWRALANGAFWVTEEVGDPFPMCSNQDFVEVPTITPENVDGVCQTLRSWIDRPQDRDAIRRRGHEHVKAFHMRHYFDELRGRVEALGT